MREVLAEGKGYMAQGVKILRYVGCYLNAGAVGDGHRTDVVTLLDGAPIRLHSLHQVTLDSFASSLAPHTKIIPRPFMALTLEFTF